MSEKHYELKYLIYKQKYLNLKQNGKEMVGGGNHKKTLILYKAQWCGFCTRFKPLWEKLKEMHGEDINFTEYDADIDHAIIKKANISGYPSLRLHKNGKFIDYNGERELDKLSNFILNN